MNTAAFEINYEVYDTLSRLAGYDSMPDSRSKWQSPRIVHAILAIAAVTLVATVLLFSEPLDVGRRFPFAIQIAIFVVGAFVAMGLILYGLLAERSDSAMSDDGWG